MNSSTTSTSSGMANIDDDVEKGSLAEMRDLEPASNPPPRTLYHYCRPLIVFRVRTFASSYVMLDNSCFTYSSSSSSFLKTATPASARRRRIATPGPPRTSPSNYRSFFRAMSTNSLLVAPWSLLCTGKTSLWAVFSRMTPSHLCSPPCSPFFAVPSSLQHVHRTGPGAPGQYHST